MKRFLHLAPVTALAIFAGCQDMPVNPEGLAASDQPLLSTTNAAGLGWTLPPPEIVVDEYDGRPVHGAIFTTLPDGRAVNANTQYTQKIQVYLDGGPRNPNSAAAGLPDGLYVYQITDPPGKVLLSDDPAKCRVVRVRGGVITNVVRPAHLPASLGGPLSNTFKYQGSGSNIDCHLFHAPEGQPGPAPGRHDWNLDTDLGGGITVQMMPFLDTPNPGGVYKAWITPVQVYRANGGSLEGQRTATKVQGKTVGYQPDPGFRNPSRRNVKTDNFKVLENPPFIQIDKYIDVDRDGTLNAGDTKQPGWLVTVYEPIEGDLTHKGWLETTATFGVPFGTAVFACEENREGYQFSYAYVNGQKVDPVAEPNEDEDGNPIVCVQVPPITASGTVVVAFGNTPDLPDLTIVKTPDGQMVNAGDPLQFDIVVSNSNAAGTGIALGVTLSDPLPTGTASAWLTITPGCSTSGTYPAQQTLNCTIGDLAPGASFSASVSSTTSFDYCTVYDNTATASATNHADVSDDGDITCRRPDLTIVKTPDGQAVSAGAALTFSMVVSNSSAAGTGTAKGVTLNDPLPTGTASAWLTITPGCSTSGTYPAQQTLNCTIGDLAPGASFSASVSSTTSTAYCTEYDNTATASSTNHPNRSDDGDITCHVPGQSRTPGYWKNHQAHTTSHLPQTLGDFPVAIFSLATDIFNAMNCGSSHPQSAIGCLAGHLLASKLNVANGAHTCINGTITNADAFLRTIPRSPSGTGYMGPTHTYPLSDAQRATAIELKNHLDRYNNNIGCNRP
jgi:uncharacterized repeat protein (TIGR01451 family)